MSRFRTALGTRRSTSPLRSSSENADTPTSASRRSRRSSRKRIATVKDWSLYLARGPEQLPARRARGQWRSSARPGKGLNPALTRERAAGARDAGGCTGSFWASYLVRGINLRTFDGLPDDVSFHVVSFLAGDCASLLSLSQASRGFRLLCATAHFWQRIDLSFAEDCNDDFLRRVVRLCPMRAVSVLALGGAAPGKARPYHHAAARRPSPKGSRRSPRAGAPRLSGRPVAERVEGIARLLRPSPALQSLREVDASHCAWLEPAQLALLLREAPGLQALNLSSADRLSGTDSLMAIAKAVRVAQPKIKVLRLGTQKSFTQIRSMGLAGLSDDACSAFLYEIETGGAGSPGLQGAPDDAHLRNFFRDGGGGDARADANVGADAGEDEGVGGGEDRGGGAASDQNDTAAADDDGGGGPQDAVPSENDPVVDDGAEEEDDDGDGAAGETAVSISARGDGGGGGGGGGGSGGRAAGRLEALSLRNRMHVGYKTCYVLARLPCRDSLRELDLSQCTGIEDDSIVLLAGALTALEALDIRGCWRVTDAAMRHIALHAHRGMRCLRTLQLSGCNFVTGAALANCACALPRIEQLGAARMPNLSDEHLDALGQGLGPRLRALDVSRCDGITTEGVARLCRACTALEHLSVASCAYVGARFVADACAAAPRGAADRPFARLASLNCRELCPGVDDRTADALVAAAPPLQKLFVGGGGGGEVGRAGIGDEALRRVAQAFGGTLEVLDLEGHARLSDEGAAHLLSPCRRLRNLRLSGLDKITDGFVEALVGHGKWQDRAARALPRLTDLHLTRCPISEGALDRLKKGRPEITRVASTRGIILLGRH